MAKAKRVADPEIEARRERRRIRERERYARARDGADPDPAPTDPAPDGVIAPAEPADPVDDLGDEIVSIPDLRAVAPPTDALPDPGAMRQPPMARAPRERVAPGRTTGRWQDSYSVVAGAVTSPREVTCIYVASLWHGGLVQISDELRAAGIDPIVDVEKLRGALVLAVDEILPAHVALTPAILAGVSTSALLTQRMVRHRAVKAAADARVIASRSSTPVQVPRPAPPVVVIPPIADPSPAADTPTPEATPALRRDPDGPISRPAYDASGLV